MSYHIICDPVHGIMEFDSDIKAIIKALIDDECFQRLRHIKQLSFAEYAYPGAVHSRFNHCIGVAYLAQCVAQALEIRKDDKHAVTVAGLLHDIGHGPFSHAFEEIYGKNQKGKKLKVDHEKWNLKFIDSLSEKHPAQKEILEQAKKIITGQNNDILHQIISSQLDVDRFDYLLRDSHFSGVSYGHFDVHWLISNLKINSNRIVVTPKGVKSVEHYLMARRLMNHNVYFHKKKCAAEYLLDVFFEKLSNNHEQLLLKSPFIEFIQQVNKYKNEDNFEKSVLENCFEKYQTLNEHHIWALISEIALLPGGDNQEIKELIEIAQRFLKRDLPEVYHIKQGKEQYVSDMLDKIDQSQKTWRIACKNPVISIYKSKTEEIFVLDKPYEGEDGSPIIPFSEVANYSTILNAFSDKSENLMYLYFSEDIKNGSTGLVKELINTLTLNGSFLGL